MDTNILLRSTIVDFPLHQQAEQLVDEYLDAGVQMWISRQVVREYITQASRPQTFMQPLSIVAIEAQITKMERFFKFADETDATMKQLIALLKAYPTGGKQVHDTNIVATMLVYEIDTLLTMNIEDFKRFSDKITLIPLST